MTTESGPNLDDLMSPAAQQNLYGIYRQMRELDPVHWNPIINAWMLTRYEDVTAALQDSRFSSAWPGAYMQHRKLAEPGDVVYLNQILPYFSMWMQGLDAPAHTRQRSLVHKAFTPRVIEGLRPQIEQIVDELLDKVVAKGQLELMQDVAQPLPSRVIVTMLGIPDEGQAKIQASSATIAELFAIIEPAVGQFKACAEVLADTGEYLKQLIAERRRNPQADLLTSLATAQDQNGEHLSDEELVVVCTMLLFAGHETTTNLLGNALVALLQHPDQLALLQNQPELMEKAVEELIRYDSPAQLATRLTIAEVEINGQIIPPGQIVMFMLGAANHDPAQFVNPDALDLTRTEGKHTGFGYGPHFCLGAALARMETQITLGKLLKRLPDLQMVDSQVDWQNGFVLRGPRQLALNFTK